MSTDLFIATYTADQMESKAEWRQRTAEKHPDDAVRNLDCANEFLDMAERLRGFRGGPWYERYCLRCGDGNLGFRMEEEIQQMTETIHFMALDPEEFFRRLVEDSGGDPIHTDPDSDGTNVRTLPPAVSEHPIPCKEPNR